MTGSPSPIAAAAGAKECLRSCSRTSPSSARSRNRRHAFSTATQWPPGELPGSTNGFPSRRGRAANTARAGAPRGTTRLPVFDEGRRRQPPARSTCSQRKVRISLRRQPVNVSSRKAPMTDGCSPFPSASRRAAPSRASSASDRKRPSDRSGYFSTCRQGFDPSGLMPHFSARLNILESSARQRLAAPGFAFML